MGWANCERSLGSFPRAQAGIDDVSGGSRLRRDLDSHAVAGGQMMSEQLWRVDCMACRAFTYNAAP